MVCSSVAACVCSNSSTAMLLVKFVLYSCSASALLHSVRTLTRQPMISRFESSVWKPKPCFCSRHSCGGTSTTPLHGTGRFSSGAGIVNVLKMECALSSSADSVRPWKMMEDMVRPYSMLTSLSRLDAFRWRSLSRSVLRASASMRLTRSFSSGGSSSVGIASTKRLKRIRSTACSRAACAAATRLANTNGSSAEKQRLMRSTIASCSALPGPSCVCTTRKACLSASCASTRQSTQRPLPPSSASCSKHLAGRKPPPPSAMPPSCSHSSSERLSYSVSSNSSSDIAPCRSGSAVSTPRSRMSWCTSCSAKSRFCRSMTILRGALPGPGWCGTSTLGSRARGGATCPSTTCPYCACQRRAGRVSAQARPAVASASPSLRWRLPPGEGEGAGSPQGGNRLLGRRRTWPSVAACSSAARSAAAACASALLLSNIAAAWGSAETGWTDGVGAACGAACGAVAAWRGAGLKRGAAPRGTRCRGAASRGCKRVPREPCCATCRRVRVGSGSPRAVLGQTGSLSSHAGADDGRCGRTCLRSAWLVGSSSASSTSE